MSPPAPRERARIDASARSSLALWTMLRRTWARLALGARDRDDRRAAVKAARELIRCELQCAHYEGQLAVVRKESVTTSQEHSRDGDV